MPDLLRLHADVLAVERAAARAGMRMAELLALLPRLDYAVAAMVGEVGRARS